MPHPIAINETTFPGTLQHCATKKAVWLASRRTRNSSSPETKTDAREENAPKTQESLHAAISHARGFLVFSRLSRKRELGSMHRPSTSSQRRSAGARQCISVLWCNGFMLLRNNCRSQCHNEHSVTTKLYFLCRCRFNSLRCLCLRIFLRRFLITLPNGLSPRSSYYTTLNESA